MFLDFADYLSLPTIPCYEMSTRFLGGNIQALPSGSSVSAAVLTWKKCSSLADW